MRPFVAPVPAALEQAALAAAAAAEHDLHRGLVPGNPAEAAAAVCSLSPNPNWKA